VAKTWRKLRWLWYPKFTYLYMHLLVISQKLFCSVCYICAMKSYQANTFVRLFKSGTVSDTYCVSNIRVLTCLDTSTPRLSGIYSSTSPGLVKWYKPVGVSGWSQLIAVLGLPSLQAPKEKEGKVKPPKQGLH